MVWKEFKAWEWLGFGLQRALDVGLKQLRLRRLRELVAKALGGFAGRVQL